MIVITTPTGDIGGHVLSKLAATDEPLRVIVRDPSKLLEQVYGGDRSQKGLPSAMPSS